MGEPARRRVTYSQLEHLWEFLNKRRELATGFNKTSKARENSRRMWEEITHNLNSHGDGAVKDWKGWCKYWNDYKSKIKKLAVAAKASQRQTGGGQSMTKPLSDIEKKILHILGDDFGSGLPGVRVEPFEDEVRIDMHQATPCSSTIPVAADGSVSILAGLDLVSTNIDIALPGPSCRVTSPLILPTTPPALSTSPPFSPSRNPISSTPRRSPRRRHTPASPLRPTSSIVRRSPRRQPALNLDRQISFHSPPASLTHHRPASPMEHHPAPQIERRRRSRREPPMTAEEARRILITESQKQTNIQEEKLKMWGVLINELRELKELFRQNMATPRNLASDG